ncbi:hypothetical protein NPIL_480581, partial [Nephila pilipes]
MKLIFKFFFFLGVPYPERNISLLIRVFEKTLSSFYSITSIYVLIVITYHHVEHSFERQTFAYSLHAAFALILRLHFVVKRKLIFTAVSSLQKLHYKYAAYPQKPLKLWVIIGCILSIISPVMGICSAASVKSQVENDLFKSMKLGIDIPETYENYRFIFIGIILVMHHVLVYTGPDLAAVLICFVYYKLGCFISDSKRDLTASYSAEIPTPKIIHSFTTK